MGKPLIPTLKHDKEKNWLKAVNYIPPVGEIIVYDADEAHPVQRLKIGDGKTHVNDLPFSVQNTYHVDNDTLKIK